MGFANSWGPQPSTLSFSPNIKFVNNNACNLGKDCYYCFRFYNIPEGIIEGAYMFDHCYNLNHNVKLPSTLQNIHNLFSYCENLNQKNLILQFNNVTDAVSMCYHCFNLPNLINPIIFNGTYNKNLREAFYDCYNLNCPYIYLGDNVYNAYDIFYQCGNLNCPIIFGNNCNFISYGGFNVFRYYLYNFNSLITIGDYFTCTNDFITYSMPNFNTDIIIGNYTNYIYGISYSCSNKRIANITIGHNCNTLKNISFEDTNYLDGTIKVGNDINYIENFLWYTYKFNGNIILGNNINYIKNFLIDCYNYNKPLYFNNTKSISYLVRHGNFNQPVYMTGTKFVDNLFYLCKFNYNIVFPETIEGTFNNIFTHCYLFNQNIKIPNNVTHMDSTFFNCNNFNQNIKIPNNVIHMDNAFFHCNNFNQNIKIPNGIQNMENTFASCYNFNQNIYIPYGIQNMNSTFENCKLFNQNIYIEQSNLVYLNSTFRNSNFNYNIQLPSSIQYLNHTFRDTPYGYNFNFQKINNLISIAETFRGSRVHENLYIPSTVLNMYYTFAEVNNFNQPIRIPENVQDVRGLFYKTGSLENNIIGYNIPLEIPSTANINSIEYILYDCIDYNFPINVPNNRLAFNYTFAGCINFNQFVNLDLATNLQGTFQNCYKFNQPVNILISGCSNFSHMFENCHNLNQFFILSESSFIYSKNLSHMFRNCKNLRSISFDPELFIFNLHRSCNLAYMFAGCSNLKFYIPNNFFNFGLGANKIKNIDFTGTFQDCRFEENQIFNFQNCILKETFKNIKGNNLYFRFNNCNMGKSTFAESNITNADILFLEYSKGFNYMFHNCNLNGVSIYGFTYSNYIVNANFSNMFVNCSGQFYANLNIPEDRQYNTVQDNVFVNCPQYNIEILISGKRIDNLVVNCEQFNRPIFIFMNTYQYNFKYVFNIVKDCPNFNSTISIYNFVYDGSLQYILNSSLIDNCSNFNGAIQIFKGSDNSI